jgi:hydroxyacylglutathione hydrolase
MSIDVHQFFLGDMDNCIYIIRDIQTSKCAIVDPAWDVDLLLNFIAEHNLDFEAVFLTHGHFDHTQGVRKCLTHKPIDVYMSNRELIELRPPGLSIQYTHDKQKIKLGNSTLHIMHTPGHSPGGQCIYSDPHLIAGDTLFINGCGRCDLRGSEPDKMYKSLQRIKNLPEDTIIYPGHNYADLSKDTLENQKQSNRFLAASSLEHFYRLRMGKRS